MNLAMMQDICGADILNSITRLLDVDLFADGNIAPLVESLFNNMRFLGVSLLVIYFMCAMIDKGSTENFTLEQFGRLLAMMVASKYLIDHGFELMQHLFSFGNEALGMISLGNIANATMDSEALLNDYLESTKQGLPTILQVLQVHHILVFGMLLLPWAFSWIMRMSVFVVVFSRIIEIYVRAAVCPIALADFFQNGLQGSGWRFLKSFLAVCLQGLMILIIMMVFGYVFSCIPDLMDAIYGADRTDNLFYYLGIILCVEGSTVMLLFKSLGLTKEVLGVA